MNINVGWIRVSIRSSIVAYTMTELKYQRGDEIKRNWWIDNKHIENANSIEWLIRLRVTKDGSRTSISHLRRIRYFDRKISQESPWRCLCAHPALQVEKYILTLLITSDCLQTVWYFTCKQKSYLLSRYYLFIKCRQYSSQFVYVYRLKNS